MAGWQSGYAAACKAADIGSIPFLAFFIVLLISFLLCPGGGIGRRKGLKIPRDLISRAGSIPALGNLTLQVSFQKHFQSSYFKKTFWVFLKCCG